MKSGWRTGERWSTPTGRSRIVRDLVRDLEAEEDASGAGLRALADDDLDRVGLPHVVRVVAVVARRHLVDERLRRGALAAVHASVACRRRRADGRGRPAERLLRVRRERAEAHPGDADRRRELDRPRAAGSENGLRLAALPVALERHAREGARDEREVVEARKLARGRERAHHVAAELGLALDVLDRLGRPDVRARAAAGRRSSQGLLPDRELLLVVAPELPGRADLLPLALRAEPERLERLGEPGELVGSRLLERACRSRGRRSRRRRRARPGTSSRRRPRRRRRRRRGGPSAS